MRPLEKKCVHFRSNSYIGTFLGAICALLGQILPKLKFRPDFFCNFLKIISSKLKKIQTSRLLHFKDQIKNLLNLPKCLTNQFCDQK